MTGDVTAGISYDIISVNDIQFRYLMNDGQGWSGPFYVRFSIGCQSSSNGPTPESLAAYKNLSLRFKMSYR